MSAFDDNQSQEQSTTSHLEKLVQSRGEQWSDPEVIAKGKLEADEHIKRLEAQLEQQAADLQSRAKMEDLVKALEEKAAAGSTAKPLETNAPEATPETPSVADIESLVEKSLQTRQEEATKVANVNAVDAQLTEKYGDKAGEVLKAKASELGVSLEDIKGIAERSPAAVMAMFGETRAPLTAPRSDVNTSNMESSSTQRNWAYYQELRKTNPKQYYTGKVQNQLMEDREALGDKFGL